MTKSKDIVALIDADVVLYQVCAVNEREINWQNGRFAMLWSDSEECMRSFKSVIRSIEVRIGATKTILALSDHKNFRKDVLPTYKSNRSTTRKPLAFNLVKDKIMKEYKCVVMPNMEGDDVLGILATSDTIKGQKIIVSIDKDLNGVPGLLFDPKKDKKPRTISQFEADLFFFTQVLTGDKTDNYFGCPNIGPKRAEQILFKYKAHKDPKLAWKYIVEAFEDAGLKEEDALAQARCARILRNTDYDAHTGEIKLYEAPK